MGEIIQDRIALYQLGKSELNSLHELELEISYIQDKIRQMESIINGGSSNLSGIPGRSAKEQSTRIAELADLRDQLDDLYEARIIKFLQIMAQVNLMPSDTKRQLIKYKYFMKMDYNQVAKQLANPPLAYDYTRRIMREAVIEFASTMIKEVRNSPV
jgi:hypothetical protein